jgi:hypothetical protein
VPLPGIALLLPAPVPNVVPHLAPPPLAALHLAPLLRTAVLRPARPSPDNNPGI